MKAYSLKTGLKKVLIQALIFGIPVLIGILPEEWQNITLGGALSLFANFLKVNYNVKYL